jgi:ribosomal protein L22
MVDEKVKTAKVKKEKTTETKVVETPKEEVKTDAPKVEEKTETPKAEKKIEQKVTPKEVAVVNAYSRRISTKHSIAICRAIMKRTPEAAIELLEGVVLKKKAIAMRGWEIPHKKWSIVSDGMGGGARFPVNSSKEFIDIIKQLKANCDVNSIDNPVITLAIANQGSKPFKREGRRGKSTHIHIEAKDRNKLSSFSLKKKSFSKPKETH